MTLNSSDLILKMFAYGERLLTELFSFVYSFFTTTLGSYVDELLGVPPPDWLENSFLWTTTVFEAVIFSIPFFVAWSFVKWAKPDIF